MKRTDLMIGEGRPKAGHYTDKNGNVVDTLDMVCNRLEIMAFAKDGAEGVKNAPSDTNAPQVDNQPTPTDDLPF